VYKQRNENGKSYGIVLGKRLADDGSATHELKERLCKAAELYLDGVIDRIIVSGGTANKKAGVTEASVMKKFLVERGIKEEDITEEGNSETTFQNAARCSELLENLEWKYIYLITSSYHAYRPYLKPARIFRLIYRLPVTNVPCYDCNVTVKGSGETNVLIVGKGNCPAVDKNRTIIYKDIDGYIRYGRKRMNIKNDPTFLEKLHEQISKIYGETELIVPKERI